MTAIYLASRSPRRQELLRQVGIGFDVLEVAEIDESRLPGETPANYVVRLAGAKARAGLAHAAVIGLPSRPVLGADTAVCLGDEIFGKPHRPETATAMLQRLSGTSHRVLTGIAVATEARLATAIDVTEVQFATLDADTIARYVAGGEPLDKAGAYAAQGIAAAFIRSIRGSHSGVVGLPLFETVRMLAAFGIRVP